MVAYRTDAGFLGAAEEGSSEQHVRKVDPMNAMPVPCVAVTSPGKIKRQVFCQKYETCLDYAIEMGWDNFSCEACGAFEWENKTQEQWAEEAFHCITLIHFLTFSKLSLKITRNNCSFGRKKRGEHTPCIPDANADRVQSCL